jgi:hypothetical protein
VVIKFHKILLSLNTTRLRELRMLRDCFLDRAATPPRRGGEIRYSTISATAPFGCV